MTGKQELPRWECHKIVQAVQILALSSENPAGGRKLHPAADFEPIAVTREWLKRHEPSAGGYYVVYKDGYTSFSPQAAFEEGYTRVDL